MKKNDLEVSSPIPLQNGIHITNQLLGVPLLFSTHSPCIFVQLPPRSSHWELQIWRTLWRWRIAWRCRSIRWERPWWRDALFFDERLADHFGCQVTSWTHPANLPSPGFEQKNKTKRKQMKRKASLPIEFGLDAVLVLIILNTKHNRQSHHQTQPTWFATS